MAGNIIINNHYWLTNMAYDKQDKHNHSNQSFFGAPHGLRLHHFLTAFAPEVLDIPDLVTGISFVALGSDGAWAIRADPRGCWNALVTNQNSNVQVKTTSVQAPRGCDHS